MSCVQEDTLLNDDEVVEVPLSPPSLTDSELSSLQHGALQGPGGLRGRWMAEEANFVVEVPLHSSSQKHKKKKKPRSWPPPPPPPPLPALTRLEGIPGIPKRRRAMFVGCLQCTTLIVILYNGSPFKFETTMHPYNMTTTTCRRCLKKRRRTDNEPTSKVAKRCEEAAAALQLSADFIKTSFVFEVASRVVGSQSVVVLERPPGTVVYVPVNTLTDEMDDDCIPLGMASYQILEPSHLENIRVLSYLPGGFL